MRSSSAKTTSSLSGKCRKTVRRVTPTDAAMSSTLVALYPRSASLGGCVTL